MCLKGHIDLMGRVLNLCLQLLILQLEMYTHVTMNKLLTYLLTLLNVMYIFDRPKNGKGSNNIKAPINDDKCLSDERKRCDEQMESSNLIESPAGN